MTALPDGAADCHAHVFGPLDRFAFIPDRGYTPAETRPADYRAMLDAIGLSRGVIVQPSVFGTDNGATLDAIAELGIARTRGVAVLPPDTPDATFADFALAGIRGVRLSDLTRGGVSLVHLEAMADRLRGSGWHIQVFANFTAQPKLAQRIRKLFVPVVVDHFGLLDPDAPADSDGFKALRSILIDGHAWLKLSAPYLVSRGGPPWSDVDGIALRLVADCPDRLLWGTDWPHPAAPHPPDPGAIRASIDRWLADAATRRRVLVDNPAALYGFADP